MTSKTIIVAALLASFTIFAVDAQNQPEQDSPSSKEEQKGGDIFKEFDNIEKEIKEKRYSQEGKELQKRETLAEAMRSSLLRFYRYKDYEKVTKDNINIEEYDKKSNIYFVKYDKFVGRFRFNVSPEEYLTRPIESKVIIKPGEEVAELDKNAY